MSYYGGTVTVKGRDLITRLIAGETITLTRVMVGSGKMPEGVEPIDMEALVNPIAEATTTVPIVENNVLSMIVEYRNDMNGGLKEGFWLNEFGSFAKTDKSDEILLYYATLEMGPLERAEEIELLRLVEHGVKIRIGVVDSDTVAVDTYKDLERVRAYIAAHPDRV